VFCAHMQASRGAVARAASRPLWNPGSDAPAWLDGTLPGDYGFDPLGLGSDPDTLKYFVQAELVHARCGPWLLHSGHRLCSSAANVFHGKLVCFEALSDRCQVSGFWKSF
jgi:hypothetical protein